MITWRADSRDAAVGAATNTKILRSLRQVGRFALGVGFLLTLATFTLGEGYLYHAVERLAWVGAILLAFRLIRSWRDDIADAYLRLHAEGVLADAVRKTRKRWYGFFVAVAAFVAIVVFASGRAIRRFVLGFDQPHRILAFIFRKRIERRAEAAQAGAAAARLPEDLCARFSEEALSDPTEGIDHYPGLDRFEAEVSAWTAGRRIGAALVVGTALTRSGSRFAHRRLQINQIATLLRFLIYFGGIAAAVGASINLSREVMLALAGTVAVTIGFALKDLASSILAGVTIIVDRPFQVGDRVKFDQHYGEITTIGLRSVRILTQENTLVTIPNNKFLTEAVSSANHGNLDMLITVDFFVSPEQDLALAKRIVEECMTSSRYIFLGKPWIVMLSQILCDTGTAVRLRAKGYVLDVKYEQEFASDVTERVLEALRARGVTLPGESSEPRTSTLCLPELQERNGLHS